MSEILAPLSTPDSKGSLFDRTFLPEAELEFVVLSDTHYMLDPGTKRVEFESRRLQTARVQRALNLIGSLNTTFVVHLGDLVQEYPETEGFKDATTKACEQLRRSGVKCHLVAGNHDIGDKPDPTMPTNWVTAESLKAHHLQHGCSWYSWDKDDLHFIVLNSQIMNSDLPQEAEQRQWLMSDLHTYANRRIFIFMHLPLYLENAQEPALGHYDNIAEPARSWLLNLFQMFHAEVVFAGHSHFSFFDYKDGTRYFVAASTSFTRPGFSEAFSSCPPLERGRNDTGKLGFYLVRILKEGVRVHLIRTWGDTTPIERPMQESRIITRLSQDLPNSPIGLSLLHPLVQSVEIPISFPSVIRQRIRNDYPLISCTELGIRHVRVPAGDLENHLQHRRLDILRNEGIRITAMWQWSEQFDLSDAVAQQNGMLDGVELQLLGTPWPTSNCLKQLKRYKDILKLPVTLSTVIPRERVPGKQHHRVRFGYRSEELVELNKLLATDEIILDRVLCRLDPDAFPWDSIQQTPDSNSLTHICAVDWIVELSTTDTVLQNFRAAEAVFAAALHQRSRIFIEPFVDLDRTMDVAYGLLDRLYNPRPTFDVVRCLNTILFYSDAVYQPLTVQQVKETRILGLKGPLGHFWLFSPLEHLNKPQTYNLHCFEGFNESSGDIWCFHLVRGTYQRLNARQDKKSLEKLCINGPTLIIL